MIPTKKFLLLSVLLSFLLLGCGGDHAKIKAAEAAGSEDTKFSAAKDQKTAELPGKLSEEKNLQTEESIVNSLLDELDKPVIVVVSSLNKEDNVQAQSTVASEDLKDAVVVKIDGGDKESGQVLKAAAETMTEDSLSKQEVKATADSLEIETTMDTNKKITKDEVLFLKNQRILLKLKERLERDDLYQMILKRRRMTALKLRIQAAKEQLENENLEKKKIEQQTKLAEDSKQNSDIDIKDTVGFPEENAEVELKEDSQIVVKQDEVIDNSAVASDLPVMAEKDDIKKAPEEEAHKSEESAEATKGNESDDEASRQSPQTVEPTSNPKVDEVEEVKAEKNEVETPEEHKDSTPEINKQATATIIETKEEEGKKEKKEDEEQENVKLEVDSIQSFEEWKKNQMQEKSDTEALENNGQTSRPVVRTKKTQINYASQDCGSKILSSNREAEHVSAILEENKDLYMLNPCSANIWFVVELCEPIQVRQLQLANFELFSSAPNHFNVYISERYPAREWRMLGSFEARNSRVLQTFEPNREELMFAKYIKFEMKSHHGSEHFCPISIVRVLGISMVEEYEESEDQSSNKLDMEGSSAGAGSSQDKHGSDGSDDEESEEGDSESGSRRRGKEGGIKRLFNTVMGVVDNILGNGKAENSNGTIVNASANATQLDQTNTETGVILVINSENDTSSGGGDDESGEAESNQQPIVTVISTGDESDLYVIPSTTPPLHPLRFLTRTYNQGGPTTLLSAQICWFLEYIYRSSIKRCVLSPHFNQTSCADIMYKTVISQQQSNKRQSVDAEVGETRPSSEQATQTNAAPPSAANHTEKTASRDRKEDCDSPPPLKISDEKAPEAGERKEEKSSDVTPSAPRHQLDVGPSLVSTDEGARGGSIDSSRLKAKDEKPEAIDIDDHADRQQTQVGGKKKASVEPKHEEKQIKEKKPATPTPSVAVEEKHDKEEAKKATENASPNKNTNNNNKSNQGQNSAGTKSESKAAETEPAADTKAGNGKIGNSKSEGKNKNGKIKDEKTKDGSSTEDHHPNQVINPGLNQKESVLMRLSNRIRSLEKNMSLSSAYLEDLSQRYKRQMDEMQRAFNRTTTRLALGARKAEENEERQQNAIDKVQRETAELRLMFEEMMGSMDQLNTQMITRHLFLMAVELFLLCLIAYTCSSSGRKRTGRQIQKLEAKINEIQEYLLTEAVKDAPPRLYRSKSNASTLQRCSRDLSKLGTDDGGDGYGSDDDTEGDTTTYAARTRTISRNYSSPDLVSAVTEEDEDDKKTTTTQPPPPPAASTMTKKRHRSKRRQKRNANNDASQQQQQQQANNYTSARRNVNRITYSENNNNNDPHYKAAAPPRQQQQQKTTMFVDKPYVPWVANNHGIMSGKAR